LSHGDDDSEPEAPGEAANSEGTLDEGLRLPDAGPIPTAPEVAAGARADDDGPGTSGSAGLAARGRGDDHGLADRPRQDEIEHTESVTVQSEIVGFSWSGPLPTPGDLGEYERIVPGSALRIIAMAETAISGPIENTRNLTNSEIDLSTRGMSFAVRLTTAMTTAAVVFFALGIALAVAGLPGANVCLTAGGVCLSVPVVMLIRSFITRS
jgi:uncharacterized membrane protein